MMDVMYEVPSDGDITGCSITKESVEKKSKPQLEYRNSKVG